MSWWKVTLMRPGPESFGRMVDTIVIESPAGHTQDTQVYPDGTVAWDFPERIPDEAKERARRLVPALVERRMSPRIFHV